MMAITQGRKVRFASRLEPPFTEADDERYFWRRFQAEEGENVIDQEFVKLCTMLFGVILIFVVVIIAVYFIFKAHTH